MSTDDERGLRLERLSGSLPWWRSSDKKRYKTRTFKSGNSLALRLPAGTRLSPGMEIELQVEDGLYGSFEPVERPKRKFNIAKVAGSATNLRFIKDEDRVFEDRPLDWNIGREQPKP